MPIAQTNYMAMASGLMSTVTTSTNSWSIAFVLRFRTLLHDHSQGLLLLPQILVYVWVWVLKMIVQVRRASVVCELPTTYIMCYYFLFCRLSEVFPHVRLTAATTSRENSKRKRIPHITASVCLLNIAGYAVLSATGVNHCQPSLNQLYLPSSCAG